MWREKYRNEYVHPEFEGTVGIYYLNDSFGNYCGLIEIAVRGVEYAVVEADDIEDIDETVILNWVKEVCLDDTHLDQAYIVPHLKGSNLRSII